MDTSGAPLFSVFSAILNWLEFGCNQLIAATFHTFNNFDEIFPALFIVVLALFLLFILWRTIALFFPVFRLRKADEPKQFSSLFTEVDDDSKRKFAYILYNKGVGKANFDSIFFKNNQKMIINRFIERNGKKSKDGWVIVNLSAWTKPSADLNVDTIELSKAALRALNKKSKEDICDKFGNAINSNGFYTITPLNKNFYDWIMFNTVANPNEATAFNWRITLISIIISIITGIITSELYYERGVIDQHDRTQTIAKLK